MGERTRAVQNNIAQAIRSRIYRGLQLHNNKYGSHPTLDTSRARKKAIDFFLSLSNPWVTTTKEPINRTRLRHLFKFSRWRLYYIYHVDGGRS